MRKIIKYSIYFICILNAILLSICALIPTINPFENSIIGILGFATPVLAIINLLFILFWRITKNKLLTIVPIIAFIISWKVFSVTIGGNFFSSNDYQKTDSTFSILSYNVRLLDLYNWSGDKLTRQKMLNFIKEKNATVICLQEFYSGNDSIGINNIKAIKDSCDYAFFADCPINVNKRGQWGSIIFSKVPILFSINHDIDVLGSNLLQEAQILFKKDTISIFNTHLKSNKFSASETNLVANNTLPEWDEKTKTETSSIFHKVEKSTINRGLEATLVSQIISKNKFPSIVCGDLNDIPSSFVYFKVRGNKYDAFLENSYGLGATYNKFIPLLRIDYIFHDEKIKLLGYEKINVSYTDHYPLFGNFSVEK